MTDAPAKSFTNRTSRRSLLKGLGAAAVGISLIGQKRSAWAAEEEPKLNFYNWDTYIGETTLADFQKASGIDVNMSLFATNDELFANFIVNKLPSGLSGFVIAGILAAALSSSLGALASATITDVYERVSKRAMTDADRLRLGRVWTIIWAGLLIVCAGLFASANRTTADPIVIQALGITGYTYGALLGAFLQAGKIVEAHGEVAGDLLAVAPCVGAHHQVLGDAEEGEDLAPLRRMADAEAHDLVGGQAGDAAAGEADLAAGGVEHAGDGSEYGGLAGTVGAEHGDDAAWLHLQRDAADGLDGAVEGLDIGDAEQRLAHTNRP